MAVSSMPALGDGFGAECVACGVAHLPDSAALPSLRVTHCIELLQWHVLFPPDRMRPGVQQPFEAKLGAHDGPLAEPAQSL